MLARQSDRQYHAASSTGHIEFSQFVIARDVVAPALKPAGAKSNDDLCLSVAKPKRQTFYAIIKISFHGKPNVTGFSAVVGLDLCQIVLVSVAHLLHAQAQTRESHQSELDVGCLPLEVRRRFV